jgi:hypothetical protein
LQNDTQSFIYESVYTANYLLTARTDKNMLQTGEATDSLISKQPEFYVVAGY